MMTRTDLSQLIRDSFREKDVTGDRLRLSKYSEMLSAWQQFDKTLHRSEEGNQ